MNKTILIGMMLVFSFFVFADGGPEGSMTIEEFLVLNNSVLHDFNVTFLLMQEIGLDTYYYFELTIYEPFYHYVYLSNESDEFETFYLIKPNRQLDYFSCPIWYIDFKDDYS